MDESSFYIWIKVAASSTFFAWISQFGNKVKILSPEPVLQWAHEEINDYIQQLQDLNDQRIIQIKRSAKGEANLGYIQRKITINKWNLAGQLE